MNKKQLAIELSKLKSFEKPKLKLEQYFLDSEIAAELLWLAYLNSDIKNKIIADLGGGTGVLSYGALLLGAKKVYLVEKDKDAVKIAKKNILNKKIRFINKDIKYFNVKVDTVIQNPPFGTKDKHIDKLFLEKAMNLSNKIYSIHKITSKTFIEKLAGDKFNIQIKNIEIPLKRIYKFHKKKIYYVKAGIWFLGRK